MVVIIDTHSVTDAFAKNAGLGFYIPYIHNGQRHDYTPDFIVRLNTEGDVPRHLILETKGWDPLEEKKRSAAVRWVAAVNAEGSFGGWDYRIAKRVSEVREILDAFLTAMQTTTYISVERGGGAA